MALLLKTGYAHGYPTNAGNHPSMHPAHHEAWVSTSTLVFGAVIYLLLILYGSLLPAHRFAPELFNPAALASAWPESIPQTDLWVNILAYIPLGGLLTYFMRRSGFALPLAVLIGFALSTSMEVVQTALPGRVPSLADVAANTGGTFFGALIPVLLSPRRALFRAWHAWRNSRVVRGPLATAALLAAALWACAQLIPVLPTQESVSFVESMDALYRDPFSWTRFGYMYLEVLGLGMLLKLFFWQPYFQPVSLFFLGVLALGVLVSGRTLDLEHFTAFLAAALVLFHRSYAPATKTFDSALISLFVSLVLSNLRPGDMAVIHEFTWVPFTSLENRLGDMANILDGLWRGLAFGILIRWRWHGYQILLAFTLFAVAAFFLEVVQSGIGRYGDVTDVLVLLAGWCLAWLPKDTLRQPVTISDVTD